MSTHRRPVVAPSAHRRVEAPQTPSRPWKHRLLPVGLGLAVLGVGAVVGPSVVMLLADAEATPKQASRFGLVGRLARERTSRPGRVE